MKKILALILMFSSYAWGAEDQLPPGFETPKPRPTYFTPEVAYYYVKGGTAIGNIGEFQSDFSYGALGTRRYADEFFYGLEYASFFGAEEYRATMYNLNFGYHLITWRNRIKPYIGGSFGYSSVSDESSTLNRPSAKGVNIGIDVGLDLINAGTLKVFGGFNLNHSILNKNQIKDLNFYILYLGAGIRF